MLTNHPNILQIKQKHTVVFQDLGANCHSVSPLFVCVMLFVFVTNESPVVPTVCKLQLTSGDSTINLIGPVFTINRHLVGISRKLFKALDCLSLRERAYLLQVGLCMTLRYVPMSASS